MLIVSLLLFRICNYRDKKSRNDINKINYRNMIVCKRCAPKVIPKECKSPVGFSKTKKVLPRRMLFVFSCLSFAFRTIIYKNDIGKA